MVVCFSSKSGHVATITLEDRKTVNFDWYINHSATATLDFLVKKSMTGNSPTSLTRPGNMQLASVSIHQKAVIGRGGTVPEP